MPPRAQIQTPNFDNTIQTESEVETAPRTPLRPFASENCIQIERRLGVAEEAPIAQGLLSRMSDSSSQLVWPTMLRPFSNVLPLSASTGAGLNAANTYQMPQPSSSPVVQTPCNHPSPASSSEPKIQPGPQTAALSNTCYQTFNIQTSAGLAAAQSLQPTSEAGAFSASSTSSAPLFPDCDCRLNARSLFSAISSQRHQTQSQTAGTRTVNERFSTGEIAHLMPSKKGRTLAQTLQVLSQLLKTSIIYVRIGNARVPSARARDISAEQPAQVYQ
ncbi:hypothetical protein BDV93DRAFT_504116 [Ceratobasidium sp. AG-I]|nr:hypothetical protein BDV93DRAFT_504116 [Ceratobasidium sp. AG-I]